MNYVICTTIVALGLILTGYATAADEINRQDVVGLMPSDYISVGNLYTPEEVATALKDKAEQAGVLISESLHWEEKINLMELPLSIAKICIIVPLIHNR